MSRPPQLLGYSLFLSLFLLFFSFPVYLPSLFCLIFSSCLSVSKSRRPSLRQCLFLSLLSFPVLIPLLVSCLWLVFFFPATIVILTNGRNNKLLHTLTLFPSFSLPLSICLTNTQQWFSFLMTTTSHHITLPPQAAAFGWVRRGRVLIHIIDS